MSVIASLCAEKWQITWGSTSSRPTASKASQRSMLTCKYKSKTPLVAVLSEPGATPCHRLFRMCLDVSQYPYIIGCSVLWPWQSVVLNNKLKYLTPCLWQEPGPKQLHRNHGSRIQWNQAQHAVSIFNCRDFLSHTKLSPMQQNDTLCCSGLGLFVFLIIESQCTSKQTLRKTKQRLGAPLFSCSAPYCWMLMGMRCVQTPCSLKIYTHLP